MEVRRSDGDSNMYNFSIRGTFSMNEEHKLYIILLVVFFLTELCELLSEDVLVKLK